jgi:hypothetical protein
MKHHRSRNLKLSPIQGAILWRLYEAGAEDIEIVVHTVRNELPEQASEGEVLGVAATTLIELYKLGLIAVSREEPFRLQYIPLPPEETYEAISQLPDYMREALAMAPEEYANRPRIYIQLTSKGQKSVVS